ncbi:hypothetical protein [Rhizobium grahamii]|uniref:Uncharacterized protein n=1 Tax=Rhizobium grahamii CCGE 502 TaxID=990285 RepID=S3IGD0_9HYPH|nr:hypothetical protein [Rhizobium grahamii]EPE98028.1 hypothetical protein RGCCGE502_14159 [Rhizobium grahamii CCGE 502]
MVYPSPTTITSLSKILAAAAFCAFLPNQAAQAQDPLADFPLFIGCELKGTYHVFFLSRVTKDGTATYTASDRIAGTITLDGKAKAVGGTEGGDCVGKTLKQLRASGQAHDLKS